MYYSIHELIYNKVSISKLLSCTQILLKGVAVSAHHPIHPMRHFCLVTSTLSIYIKMYLLNSVKSKAGHSVKPTGVNHKLSMSEQKNQSRLL